MDLRDNRSIQAQARQGELYRLTQEWGSRDSVSLYLQRCQVATPDELVKAAWCHVQELREHIRKVVDFGAGNGRFAHYGRYEKYIGYEIDSSLFSNLKLPERAILQNECAFSGKVVDADVCIGNPPFVRNQDLPTGWRRKASEVLHRRTGVSISGLANAWQYFFLLSLASVKESGLCVLIIPYEWVSRPSAKPIREYIRASRWNVKVYRLVDTTFSSVLTTSSITIVDKDKKDGSWSYFEETAAGTYSPLNTPSGGSAGVIPYLSRRATSLSGPRAKRGLSPGTQKVLTLTEGERVRSGLNFDRDVVPCVTTLRHLPGEVQSLEEQGFRAHYRTPNQKCWLIRTDIAASPALAAYLGAVREVDYQTSTCLAREEWWKFSMPTIPDVLMSTSFKGKFPKAVLNSVGARAVGGVAGIYNLSPLQIEQLIVSLDGLDIGNRIVAHANGLRKIEIGQLNAVLADIFNLQGSAAR